METNSNIYRIQESDDHCKCVKESETRSFSSETFHSMTQIGGRSFGSNRVSPCLHPSPGKMPGSRKRRVNASNGPNSLSQTTLEKSSSPLVQITPIQEGKISLHPDFESARPTITDAETISPTSPSRHSPYLGATPPIRNTMKELTMTPPRLPLKHVPFGFTTSPSTPEITTFKNLSIRSPILSNSPGSSFSHYPYKFNGRVTSPSVKMASPVFQSTTPSPVFQSTTPSPRQVPLKVLSNCTTYRGKLDSRSLSETRSPRSSLTSQRKSKLSPRFSNKNFSPRRFPTMGGVDVDTRNSPSQRPMLLFSSQVTPNESYGRHSDGIDKIYQKVKEPWAGQIQNEIVRPPRTPTFLPTRISSKNRLKNSGAISSLIENSTIEQCALKKAPSLSPHDNHDEKDVNMGIEMNLLRDGFLERSTNDAVSDRSGNHVPRNINIPQVSRKINSTKGLDSVIFSDDDSLSWGGKSGSEELSLKQKIKKNKTYVKGNGHNHSQTSQRSISKPVLPSSNEAFDEMVDASQSDDTFGSLSDDEGFDSFFLTSPRGCFEKNVPAQALVQDSNIVAGKKIENRQKKKKNSTILNSKMESYRNYDDHKDNVVSLSGSTADSDPDLPKNDRLRKHHQLSNMDIIRENSISNVSLVGMVFLPNVNSSLSLQNYKQCSESSKSCSDDSSTFDRSYGLKRNCSDHSLNSLGLCLDGVPLYSDTNSRDMVTPPVIRNESLTPPPIKKTKLGLELHGQK